MGLVFVMVVGKDFWFVFLMENISDSEGCKFHVRKVLNVLKCIKSYSVVYKKIIQGFISH